MEFELIISPIAFKETNNAYDFYESQSPGLGNRFLKALDDAYKKLRTNPNYYSFINSKKDLRDIKIKRFPFLIIFQIIQKRVFVLSVFNTNRNPALLKRL